MRYKKNVEEADYVVIGGGSTGSVVAGRLAEAGHEVVVLEAGSSNRRPEVVLPVGIPVAYKYRNWNYLVEPDASLGGTVEKWPAGRVLGGGGSINAGLFERGNALDYDGWADVGNPGWDYASVLPAFRRLESWEDGPTAFRGGGGPIGVRRHRVPHVANDAFMRAAQEAGHALNPDYNSDVQDGVGVGQVNQRGHFRSEAAREYLRGLPHRFGEVHIQTAATAERIVFDGDRAVGVEYRRHGSFHLVRARREIVLSAGAIGTPKLLLLSGIGPAEELRRLGVDVVHDVPGVGANLHEHPMVLLRFKALVPNLNTMGPVGALRGVGQYITSSSGFLVNTMGHAQLFHRTDPDLTTPNILMNFANFGVVRTVKPDGEAVMAIPREGSFVISLMYTQPTPRGRVSLRSSSAAEPPRIEYEFLADRHDVQSIVAGVRETLRVMAQPALKGISGGLIGPDARIDSDAGWETWLRGHTHGAAHPVGTARMGNDGDAVVDAELRVHGVANLRVADASIMPRIINASTNASAMMIGEKAAEFMSDGGAARRHGHIPTELVPNDSAPGVARPSR